MRKDRKVNYWQQKPATYKELKNIKWARFNRYLYKYWGLQTAAIALGLVSVPLGLLNPYLAKEVIDKAYGNHDLKLFIVIGIAGGAAFVLNSLITAVTGYLSRIINRNVHYDMTRDFFRHVQDLPLSFFDNHSTGEHIYRISSDVRGVSDLICTTLPQIITMVPRLLFLLCIVFFLNWKLAIFAAALVPVTYIQPFLFGKWMQQVNMQTVMKTQGIFSELQEVFSHIHLVKAMGRRKYETERFEANFKDRMDLELKNARVSNIGGFTNSVVNKAVSGLIALYGGYMVIKGQLTLGSLTAIMIYLTQMVGLLKSIGQVYQTIIVSAVPVSRVGEILDAKTVARPDRADGAGKITAGEIEFRRVTFGYTKEKKVLGEMSFIVKPGAKIALAGASGCGKTTILSLLLGLYDIAGGQITVDRQDIRNIDDDALKTEIGVALQEPFLWNDTISNNIVYGKLDASADEIVWAAKMAEAHDFILSLPEKYDSVIGEMACKLSEGQKQRIALARALIKKPRILLLDEAFASLDSETEDKVTDNIFRELKDSVVISISHRLSSVKKMDLVYFLENGEKIYIKSHAELLETCGKYKELFSGQLIKEVSA